MSKHNRKTGVYVNIEDLFNYINQEEIRLWRCDCEGCSCQRSALKELRNLVGKYPDTSNGVPTSEFIPVFFHQPDGSMWNKIEDFSIDFTGRQVIRDDDLPF